MCTGLVNVDGDADDDDVDDEMTRPCWWQNFDFWLTWILVREFGDANKEIYSILGASKNGFRLLLYLKNATNNIQIEK